MMTISIVIVINTFVSVRWIQFIFLWILILFSYFLERNSPDILAQLEINMDDSINSGNFSVTVYLRLIQNHSITHMYLLAVYVKEELRLHGTCLWKFLQILTYGFNSLYLTQFLTSFSSFNHPLYLYAWFLILFHLTEMMFSWSTHLLMFLLLETLMSFIRTS